MVRRDGRPAAGTEVVVGGRRATTDDRGHAVLERLRPGARQVEVRDPDFVWARTQVVLANGGSRAIVLAEPPGWTARAILLDAVGRSVPLAAVQVRSRAPVSYLRVEDGVQDLVHWTDASGEIRLPRMHHAPVELTFRYGSRIAAVTLEESDPYAVVRLPPPG